MLNVYEVKIAHPELFQQISVKDRLFVYYRCPQTEQLVRLYNNYEEIIFTLSGRKVMHIADKSWELNDEDAFLVRKTAYVQEMFNNVDWEVLAFHFNIDFIQSIVQEFNESFTVEHIPPIPRDMILRIKVNPNIRANFYSILPLFSENIKYAESLIERRVRELVINILAEPKNINILAYFNHIFDQNKIPIWHVMESNFMFNLPLSEFAKLCQRSISTFKSDFKKHYKTTPGKWLLKKRLIHAKGLLENSSKNISDVAYQSGFENTSHFSRVFKDQFGNPPSEFRNRHIA